MTDFIIFTQNAHLAMITSLMQAHAVNVITIERITQAVRRFTTFNASSELPSNMEDAVCFWMNKIAGTVLHRAHRDLVRLNKVSGLLLHPYQMQDFLILR